MAKKKQPGVTETELNPRDPAGDLAAKRKALQDLSMNKDVDQAAVQQRKLDLDREANTKGVEEGWYNSQSFPGAKVGANLTGQQPRTPVPQVKDQIIKSLMTNHKDIIAQYGSRDVNIVAQSEATKADTSPQGITKAVNNVVNFLTSGLSVNRLRQQTLEQGVTEDAGPSPVTGAITRRILSQHLDLLKQYGPELVGAAVDNVADYVGDVEEIGSSDVSAWVNQVERMLKENPPEAFDEGYASTIGINPPALDPVSQWKLSVRHLIADYINDPQSLYNLAKQKGTNSAEAMAYKYMMDPKGKIALPPDAVTSEGFQDFNKVEPYAVCLAGKPVKQFDYYEQARRFHDNWKQKLYREGDKAKADKITLMPVMDEASVNKKPQPYNKDWTKDLTKDQLNKLAGPRYNNKKPVKESYWAKLQDERSTRLNSLVNELKESVKK